MSLFNELKRRNVIRVTIAYVILSWLVMQVADVNLHDDPRWLPFIENLGNMTSTQLAAIDFKVPLPLKSR